MFYEVCHKPDRLSLAARFFDSSKLFTLQLRNSPRKLSGFKQSKLFNASIR